MSFTLHIPKSGIITILSQIIAILTGLLNSLILFPRLFQIATKLLAIRNCSINAILMKFYNLIWNNILSISTFILYSNHRLICCNLHCKIAFRLPMIVFNIATICNKFKCTKSLNFNSPKCLEDVNCKHLHMDKYILLYLKLNFFK